MRVTVYEDDHEKQTSQSDGEIMKKVIINEASTLVNTVINSRVPPEGFGSEKTSTVSRARMTKGRVLEQTFLRTRVLHGLSENGAEAWSDRRLHSERVLHGQEARHLIVEPGHKDSTQNMITGALQADRVCTMVPAASSFTTVLAIDNHKADEIQGQRDWTAV